MLLLHMQEIVFVDSQEGLLSSRGGGGGGAYILAPGLQLFDKHCSVHLIFTCTIFAQDIIYLV